MITAVVLVVVVGQLGPDHAPDRASTGSGAVPPAPGASPVPPAEEAAAVGSEYTLRPEGGPYVEPAARAVTATLLLTALVLTALGALGARDDAPCPDEGDEDLGSAPDGPDGSGTDEVGTAEDETGESDPSPSVIEVAVAAPPPPPGPSPGR
jgi:hypothetical protein